MACQAAPSDRRQADPGASEGGSWTAAGVRAFWGSHATTVGVKSAPSRLRWVSVKGGAASTISATYSADDLTLTRRFGGAASPLGPGSGSPAGARGGGDSPGGGRAASVVRPSKRRIYSVASRLGTQWTASAGQRRGDFSISGKRCSGRSTCSFGCDACAARSNLVGVALFFVTAGSAGGDLLVSAVVMPFVRTLPWGGRVLPV